MRLATVITAALLLNACAGLHSPAGDADSSETSAETSPSAKAPPLIWVAPAVDPPASGLATGAVRQAWTHQRFPGKRVNRYQVELKDGREVVAVESRSGVSVLRKELRIEAADLSRLRFSWQVPALIAAADLDDAELSDSPASIVLAFEGDRSRFPARDAMLSELALALTGEPMPYATLMYVWCNACPVGSVIQSKRTSRIRKLVVESGPLGLNRWLEYERDVRADFERAFGEPPGALLSVGFMTDSDNTRSQARAWYGPLRHVRTAAPPP